MLKDLSRVTIKNVARAKSQRGHYRQVIDEVMGANPGQGAVITAATELKKDGSKVGHLEVYSRAVGALRNAKHQGVENIETVEVILDANNVVYYRKTA